MSRGFKAGVSVAAIVGATMALGASAQAYTVYVTNEKGNSVSVIDTATMAVTGTWKVGRRPRGVTMGFTQARPPAIVIAKVPTSRIVRS